MQELTHFYESIEDEFLLGRLGGGAVAVGLADAILGRAVSMVSAIWDGSPVDSSH